MTTTQAATKPSYSFASTLINGILAVKPLANFAKHQARTMMVKRAESMGVSWRKNAQALKSRGSSLAFSPKWDKALAQIQADLTYPDYYLTSFHAYEQGNLSWEAATEVESASQTVHAKIWPEAGPQGDAKLRHSYDAVIQAQVPISPQDILDLGCGVGMSTFALQALYPHAQATGVDLSPYFLAIAQYRDQQRLVAQNPEPEQPDATPITWRHAAAESTGLPDNAFDLVSVCLVYHELPQDAAIAILNEARRVLRPNGYLTLMDMNPNSEFLTNIPSYVLTLLKSTEPYLDQYFSLDLAQAMVDVGFQPPTITYNSPRHRTLVAQA